MIRVCSYGDAIAKNTPAAIISVFLSTIMNSQYMNFTENPEYRYLYILFILSIFQKSSLPKSWFSSFSRYFPFLNTTHKPAIGKVMTHNIMEEMEVLLT